MRLVAPKIVIGNTELEIPRSMSRLRDDGAVQYQEVHQLSKDLTDPTIINVGGLEITFKYKGDDVPADFPNFEINYRPSREPTDIKLIPSTMFMKQATDSASSRYKQIAIEPINESLVDEMREQGEVVRHRRINPDVPTEISFRDDFVTPHGSVGSSFHLDDLERRKLQELSTFLTA